MLDYNYLAVGMKKGAVDFSLMPSIRDLTYDEMQAFRAMVMVAIGTAEDMWRRARAEEAQTGST